MTTGEVVGRWKQIGSGLNSVHEVTFVEGTTSTEGTTISAGLSATLSTSLSSTIGFAQPTGPTASTTSTIEVSVTADIRTSFTRTLAVKKERRDSTSCKQATSSNKWWMYQWVIDVPYIDGQIIEVSTSTTVCLACNNCEGPMAPVCPNMNKCKNNACSKCFN